MDQTKFQNCYSSWLENPSTTFARVIKFEETHFIFEISPSKKALNFVIKFLTSVQDKEIKKIFEVFFEIINQRKEEILQGEKDAGGRCNFIRVLVEILQGRFLPSRLDSVGSSLKTMCNIRIAKQDGWQMNGKYNILCYGRVDAIIELHIFGPDNLLERKVNKTFYIQSYDTLAEVKDKMRSSGFIEEEYTIGNFFFEENVFEDQSEKLTACSTMFPNPNDICCKIVHN